jgi:hypothetical protein
LIEAPRKRGFLFLDVRFDNAGALTEDETGTKKTMTHFLILGLLYLNSPKIGHCTCESDTSLGSIISCDTIVFSNGSKLFRQFNCDSSWLTFEDRRMQKRVFYSLQYPLIDLTERLGYQFVMENNKSFVIRNNLISGCCTPPEYILFDKDNGNLLQNARQIIYYSEEKKYDFMLAFGDSTLNNLTLFAVNTGNKYKINLPQDLIIETLQKTGEFYPQVLFDTPEFQDSTLSIGYRYQKKEEGNKWHKDKLVINLSDYVFH